MAGIPGSCLRVSSSWCIRWGRFFGAFFGHCVRFGCCRFSVGASAAGSFTGYLRVSGFFVPAAAAFVWFCAAAFVWFCVPGEFRQLGNSTCAQLRIVHLAGIAAANCSPGRFACCGFSACCRSYIGADASRAWQFRLMDFACDQKFWPGNFPAALPRIHFFLLPSAAVHTHTQVLLLVIGLLMYTYTCGLCLQ